MRVVLEGTPRRRHRLRARDLPSPPASLADSFFQYVNAERFDFTPYDTEGMWLADVDAAGSIWPTLKRVSSRRGDFTGATLAGDASGEQHDFVLSALMANLVTVTDPTLLNVGATVLAYFGLQSDPDHYRKSWREGVPIFLADFSTRLGLNRAQVRQMSIDLWTGFPTIQRQSEYIYEHPELWTTSIPPDNDPAAVPVTTRDGRETVDVSTAITGSEDGFAEAQRVAFDLLTQTGDEYHVRMTQTTPYPIIEAVAKERVAGDDPPAPRTRTR